MAEKKQTVTDNPEPMQQPTRRPVEAWRDALGTPAWLFAAAQAKYNWPVGYECAENDYRAALHAAENEVIR